MTGFRLYAIPMVSEALPRGWRIYVKEHPGQFEYVNRGERGRFRAFYESIRGVPGCRLIDMDASPFDLIDNARLVATVTGSASLEASARGKKSVIFGRPAFYGAPSVYSVETKKEIEEVISQPELPWESHRAALNEFLVRLHASSGDIDDPSPALMEAVNLRRASEVRSRVERSSEQVD